MEFKPRCQCTKTSPFSWDSAAIGRRRSAELFAKLGLCDSEGEPTLSQEKREFYESLSTASTAIMICNEGHTLWGIVCVPDIVAKLTGTLCNRSADSILGEKPPGHGQEWQAATTAQQQTLLVDNARPKGKGKIVVPRGNWDWVAKHFRISPYDLSDIIHGCKEGGIRGDDDLGVDLETGDLYDMRTGERIGDVFRGC